MQLVEVDVVRAEPGQRLLELRRGARPAALRGLAGEKDARPVRHQRGAEPLLRVAVGGGHVEIVHAALDKLRHDAVGVGLLGIHHDNAAHPDDRELDTVLAERPAGQEGGVGGGRGHALKRLGPGRVGGQRRDGQGGDADEPSPAAVGGIR